LEISHTGGAVGASSVLFLVPNPPNRENSTSKIKSNESTNQTISTLSEPKVRGISVAIICNLQGVSLMNLARSIAREFRHPC